jgi:hypothetical protein
MTDWLAPAQTPDQSPQATIVGKNQARKQATGQSTQSTRNQHGEPGFAERQSDIQMTKVGIVAEDAERHDAGNDHRSEQDAAHPVLKCAAHFLNRKDHPGQRCVECGRKSGRRTRRYETCTGCRVGKSEASAQRVKQTGADMHGWAFSSD